MALRMGYVYDALRQAQGVPEEAARQAAEEVAGYEKRMRAIEDDLVLLKWMVGSVMAVLLLNLAATLTVLYRLP